MRKTSLIKKTQGLMQLIIPSINYEKSYLKAIDEARDETGTTLLSRPMKNQAFEDFVQQKKEEAQGLHLPLGWVPATELWLIDGGEFIGWVNIRHTLTDSLLQVGGHIGYWIRPSKRNLGYGKEILRLALPEAEKLGITKILLTCDDTNIGSQKIIEANGGILENIVDTSKGHPKKRRYWITRA